MKKSITDFKIIVQPVTRKLLGRSYLDTGFGANFVQTYTTAKKKG